MTILGDNIKKRLKDLALTQKEIADQAGISQVMIHKLMSGKSPTTTKVLELAKALRCSPDWLIYGKGSPEESWSNVTPGPDIQGRVPLISSVQAGIWSEIVDNFQPGDAEEWRETTAKVGKHAFALRVQGDSMINPQGFPSIPAGAVVIVDPDTHPDSGKIVVARLEDTMEATIKKLMIDGPNKYLMPLNPDYRPIKINGNCTIVGVVKKVEFDL